ncbi:hypothetical protein HG535_0H03110 [Zygotorulaspora mrakii]|uniref:Uncharacterized protein n=1 Tax=Zygotorulaspora mrakii TaxID=42260 RepID=A0A7H9B9L0_ZYGMR|nr:uncharacterized protein HG535_0H03110 [Zygotorulaspora mrakii]QLG74984.1 hypothetical protein HG535_0H03110 [Zygotorulaspora mrakii]
MDELTISYGLLAPQVRIARDSHILPISKILYPSGQTGFFLTCGRDGSVIKHKCDFDGNSVGSRRMQVHSDWVSDIIQVDENKFITVSYDFSIILLTLHEDELDTWDMKIIGDHDDYIKNIAEIPASNGGFLFATGGLDKKVKIWSLENDSATLVHEYDNSQADDTGSIYALASVDSDFSGLFDLVAGDCNGNIIFYSSLHRTEILRIDGAHDTNIKIIRLIDNCTRLITASSDGYICVWDLTHKGESFPKVRAFKWDCSIWAIKGSTIDHLYIGDSKGGICRADLSDEETLKVDNVYGTNGNSKNDHCKKGKKAGGILDIMVLPNDILMFSKSTDSNLYRLKLRTNSLKVSEGGFALTKSSLLTNRRHVITENSRGEIQRWDIVTCALVNTFEPSEGNFDEVVSKYTSREILSHWCSVSVKVGMLFVKLNPRLFNTEVYGSALESYKVVNGIQLSADERYNLGKIVVNSLFNEFLNYEIEKDKSFRKNLSSKRKESLLHHKDGSATPTVIPEQESTSKGKDKRKRSAFYRFTSTAPASESGSPIVSAPSTPVLPAENSDLPVEEHPLLPPSANLTSSTEVFAESSDALNASAPKSSDGRALSSGSLIGRKLRMLKTYSTNRPNNGTSSTGDALVSDVEDSFTEDENTHEPIVWNQSFSNENSNSQQAVDAIATKLKNIEVSQTSSELAVAKNHDVPKPPSQSMSDYIDQLHEGYVQQFVSNHSSLKLLARKTPETRIVRDTASPILRIRNGVLLVVHNWKKNSCGPTALFSTYLPASRTSENDSGCILNEGDDDEEDSQSNEEEKLFNYEQIDHECGNGMSKRQIFEGLERNLPFWSAKALLCDTMITKQQSKLNFVITPWQPTEQPVSPTTQVQQHGHQHHRLRFGRSKSSDLVLSSSDLPKISDSNMKLVAPGMIKVKKIKTYIADRFESKTPEMKAKIEPSEWLEILCKNQVLDNDMTLSTVRTLYWKSRGDIVFEYRRKCTDLVGLSPLTESHNNK